MSSTRAARRVPDRASTPSSSAARRSRSAPDAIASRTRSIRRSASWCCAKPGDAVRAGDAVLELHYRDRAPARARRCALARPGDRDRRRAARAAAAHRRRGALMFGVLQPVFGAVVILGIAVRVLDQPARDQLDDGRLGPQPADRLRADRAEDDDRSARVRDARRRHHASCSASPASARRSSSVRSATAASGGASMTGALGAGRRAATR